MILTVDIGNTQVAFGGFCGERLEFVVNFPTEKFKTGDQYVSKSVSDLKGYGAKKKTLKGAVISSVVPDLNGRVSEAISRLFGVKPLIVSHEIKTDLQLRCDDPSTVGADIICACVGVKESFGAPALIVDMGTATKIIYLDGDGAFSGVAIMPGVMMGLEGLSSGTAQLPKVSLAPPPSAIGKNTADCMRSGAVYGNAAMVDGMIDRIEGELKLSLPVYATGGFASSIVCHCKRQITLDEALVLRGLYLIYKKNI